MLKNSIARVKYLKTRGRVIPLIGCLIGLWGIGPQPTFAIPSLTTTPLSNASNLALDGEGSASSRIVKVANIAAETDNSTGLSLSISSGSISKSGGTSISFQIVTVNTGAPSPSSAAFTVASGNNYIYTTSQAGLVGRDLYIYYTPGSLQDPGSYLGSILLSITDNP